MPEAPARKRRPKRTTAEVRAAVLGAAARQFSAGGYSDTSLRSVADEATVSLSVLQRHYPTKDDLFLAAVLVPLLEEIAAIHAAAGGGQEARATLEELYRQIGRHRLAVLRILEPSGDPSVGGTETAMGQIVRVFVDLVAAPAGGPERDGRGDRLDAIVAVSAVLGFALLHPALDAADPSDLLDAGLDVLPRIAGLIGAAPDAVG